MKRLLVLVALLLIPAVAYAGWNIRQKDDGSTVWTNEDSVDVPVGDSGVTVNLEDISTASSAYIVSHKAGTLKRIWVVVNGTLSVAAPTLSFHISDYSSLVENATASGPTPVSTGATITLALTGAAGDRSTVAPVLGPRPATDGSTVSVNQGDVIIVYTNGVSTGDVDGTITYIIE